ncbi:MAG: guanylate kinase [Bdellovibrionaceae bacterium]|nr:guanylate kinase [Pseudobdellovibrionaceae bacterium]
MKPTDPKLIILVGPSGAGKSSFLTKALEIHSELVDTTTYTTREIRAGESEGHPYHFVSTEDFERRIEDDFFVEHARVHDNYYGTPHHQIVDAHQAGQVVIMDVDVQGARTFKAKFPRAIAVFILPPSVEELRRRIQIRDQGKTPNFELRLENAVKEIQCAEEFDFQVVNADFDTAFREFQKIIEEYLKTA